MTIEITPEEHQILIDSMRNRIDKLFNMAEAYKYDSDGKRDCYAESRRVKELLDKIQTL